MFSLLSRTSHFHCNTAKAILSTRRVHSSESPTLFANPSLLRRRLTARFTAAARIRRLSDSSRPAMDSRSPEIEDFVRIENATAEDLSESIVRVDQPRENDDAPTTAAAAEGSEPEAETVPEAEAEAEPEPEPQQSRNALLQELSRSMVALECESNAEGGVCHVYLVGTAHVSAESCREVEAVISYLRPEVVFLELCSSRASALNPQTLQVPTMGEMLDLWKRNHNIFGIIYGWFLAKVASQLDVFPGSEFRVAYEEAMKYGGRVILGDRPVHITLKRTWAKMPRWHKIKLLYSLFFQAIFLPSTEDLTRMLREMDNVDMLTFVIQEMSKEFPTLMETLVHERDKYMSSMLLRIAGDHASVVAVVGKGHLQGIKNHWKQPVVMDDLIAIPSEKPVVSRARILKSLSIAVAGVAIISGVYLFRKK